MTPGLVIAALSGALLGMIAGGVWARRRQAPLRRIADLLDRVNDGDLTVRVAAAGSDDVARVAVALNRMLDAFTEAVGEARGATVRLSACGGRLSALVDEMIVGAQGSVQASGNILRSAQDVTASISTLATGSEEMSASIQEISRGASEAVNVAANAMKFSAEAGDTMTKLGDSSSRVGDVVRVITSIAEQTNLLALNATIEAARAGEMGKGFAVVAGEVKDLAQETAKATEDITTRVGTIQADTNEVVRSIAQIGDVIDKINDYQTSIAGAVEEQHTTAETMTGSIISAGARAAEIADAMTAIAQTRKKAKATVDETGAVAREFQQANEELAAVISRFRIPESAV